MKDISECTLLIVDDTEPTRHNAKDNFRAGKIIKKKNLRL
jgi:hypothetical protein